MERLQRRGVDEGWAFGMGSNTATITQLLGQLYEATSFGQLDVPWPGEREDVVQLSRAIQTESALRRFGGGRATASSAFDIEPQERTQTSESLAPHLTQSGRVQGATDSFRSERSMLAQSVDQAQLAVVMLNRKGEVVQMTRSARTLLAEGDGLALRGKALRATVMTEHALFSALLTEAMRVGADRCDGDGAMLIARRAPRRPLQIVVTPVRAGELSVEMQGAVMVFLCDPEAVPSSRAPILRRLYGLTPTEGRLADELAAGTELQVAAQRLRLTVHTARFHLKSIFRKMSVNRQNDLVRLVLGLPGTTD